MNVILENIGIIKKADIQLNGMTVITGYNDSGKSTLGKALYSYYYGKNSYLKNLHKDAIEYALSPLRKIMISDAQNLYELLIDTDKSFFYYNIFGESEEIIKRIRDKYPQSSSSEDDFVRQLKLVRKNLDWIKAPDFKKKVKCNLIQTIFKTEFDDKINNVYAKEAKSGKLCFQGQKHKKVIVITNDNIEESSDDMPIELDFSDVIYIDTPVTLSDASELVPIWMIGMLNENHVRILMERLISSSGEKKNIVDDSNRKESLKDIDAYIKNVLHGEIKFNNGKLEYQGDDNKKFGVGAIANGLKSFAIIKRLLDNGYMQEDSLFIIDEPEVHLHPEWQLFFAELLVILQMKLKLKMLITSHSPYFLQAIEVFSKKYIISDTVHYYLAERQEDGAIVRNVDNDLDATYKLLAQPIIKLREMYEALNDDNR